MVPLSARVASALAIVLLAVAAPARTTDVVVSTTAQFRAALTAATAGTTISLRPGVYEGGSYRRGLRGTPEAPIVVRGADRANPPRIVGSANGIALTDASYVTLEDLIIDRPSQNGINIDDGDTFETPSHHIVIRRVSVRDLPPGNNDGIKLSGVTDFTVEDSTFERWGEGGSAIGMVGSHRGVIRNSTFRHTPGMTIGNGVQTKGGSADITVTGNRFESAAARAVQIGGNTDVRSFRPQPPGSAEARDIVVERNVFVGGETAVAFVSSDGGTVRFNTIYQPTSYLLRILRENVRPEFTPTERGNFTDNVVYWTGPLVVNVGGGTRPETFAFARNHWYRADAPGQSRPRLPGAETGGSYGVPLDFVAPPTDLHTRTALPAGAYAR